MSGKVSSVVLILGLGLFAVGSLADPPAPLAPPLHYGHNAAYSSVNGQLKWRKLESGFWEIHFMNPNDPQRAKNPYRGRFVLGRSRLLREFNDGDWVQITGRVSPNQVSIWQAGTIYEVKTVRPLRGAPPDKQAERAQRIDEIKKALAAAEHDRDVLKKTAARLKDNLAELEKSGNATDEELAKYHAAVKHTAARLAATAAKIAELRARLAELAKQPPASMEARIESAAKKAQELRLRLEVLQKDKAFAEMRAQELRAQLAEVEQRREPGDKRLGELRAALNETEQRRARLAAEEADARARLADLKARIDQLKAQMAAAAKWIKIGGTPGGLEKQPGQVLTQRGKLTVIMLHRPMAPGPNPPTKFISLYGKGVSMQLAGTGRNLEEFNGAEVEVRGFVRQGGRVMWVHELRVIKPAPPPFEPTVGKWELMGGENATYRKLAEAEEVRAGEMVLKEAGHPMAAGQPILKTDTGELRLIGAPPGKIEAFAGKRVEVKGKPRAINLRGETKHFFWVGWIRQVKAEAPAP